MRLLLSLVLLMVSVPALACWRLHGKFTVKNETKEFEHKVLHDKSYSFPHGDLIMTLIIPSKFQTPPRLKDAKDLHFVDITISEKKGTKLKEVTRGQVIVKGSEPAVFTSQDQKTKEITKLEITLEHI